MPWDLWAQTEDYRFSQKKKKNFRLYDNSVTSVIKYKQDIFQWI